MRIVLLLALSQCAVVLELQMEVSFPPNERERSTRSKWVTAAWGCIVPLADGNELQQGRLQFEICHGSSQVSPLSKEAVYGAGALLASGALASEMELKASATWKETLQVVRTTWLPPNRNSG